MDDLYEFTVRKEPGTRTEVYVAKLIGEDPTYIYRREFVPLEQRMTEDGFLYAPELDSYGVFECSIKWYEDIPDGKFLGRGQRWYLVFDSTPYRIPPWTVTDTLRWLSKFLAAKGGDDV